MGVDAVAKINRKTVIYVIGAALLLVIAYYSRAFHTQVSEPAVKMLLVMIRSVIQITLVIGWCSSVRTRIINRQVRRYLMATGALLAFWLILRTCKWEFIASSGTDLGRYLWYSYYIPIIFVPLMGLFIVDHIGKPEKYITPEWMNYLYIPACLLVSAVFTNDLHQMVFSFPKGFEFCESDYSYHSIYFVIMAWCLLLSFYFVVMLLKKSRVPASRNFQKLPGIILMGAVIFWVLYCMNIAHGDLAAVNCIVIIMLLESAIQSGLIPSNTKYNELFRSSTVCAQIVDKEYHPCIVSKAAGPLTADVMKSAENGPVDFGDTVLHSKMIKGGHVLWLDDIGQINQLIEKLRDTQERLGESNEIIRAEIDIKEKRAGTEEKSRLYDRIAGETAPQLEKADELLELAERNPQNAKSRVARVSVICAYIKRKGNLMLLGEERKSVPSRELEYCIRESLDNLRLAGIITSFETRCEDDVNIDYLVAAFDFYEDVIEKLFEDATAIMIYLDCSESRISIRMQIGCLDTASEDILADIKAAYGTTCYELQDEDITVTLLIEGGDTL